jgi:hypothetical protein
MDPDIAQAVSREEVKQTRRDLTGYNIFDPAVLVTRCLLEYGKHETDTASHFEGLGTFDTLSIDSMILAALLLPRVVEEYLELLELEHYTSSCM